ncbi:non-ribosomal peptide synthetase [Pelomyxa schiedti]|nr:non-ribosomal peptide synthetase [Pelomyxa schiedti]
MWALCPTSVADFLDWIENPASRPKDDVLTHPIIISALLVLYSSSCFVASALSHKPGGATDDDHFSGDDSANSELDDDRRFRSFVESFDVAIGYCGGLWSSCAISKADSLDKMREICLEGMILGDMLLMDVIEAHTRLWGKQAMLRPWMCSVKGPLEVLEENVNTVNCQFPTTPISVSIRLRPNHAVVCGHPDALDKLVCLLPLQSKLLPVHEAFHMPFYQREVLEAFLRKYPQERTSSHTDVSQLDAVSFAIQLQKDSLEQNINWPETVKAAISHNRRGNCDTIEIFDFGPSGIGALTHNLCTTMFQKTCTIFNCVTAHDPPKIASEPSMSIITRAATKIDITSLTPVEIKVLEIWCEALGSPPDSIDKEFFAAGGDSIAALKVLASTNKLGWNMNLSDLFRNSITVRSMAAAVSAVDSHHPCSFNCYSPITARRSTKGIIPLSPAQNRLFFLDQLQPNSAQYSVFIGFHLLGHQESKPLWEAIRVIVNRHESLRTTFFMPSSSSTEEAAEGTGQPCQRILSPEDSAHAIGTAEFFFKPETETTDTKTTDDDDEESHYNMKKKEKWLSDQCQKEVKKPFDLQTGPLLRVTLFRLDEEEDTVLFLNIHHIVTDGWSLVLFLKELSHQYNTQLNLLTACNNRISTSHQVQSSPFPPLPFQYADFAIWQREVLLTPASELREKQLSFWKKELDGVNDICPLPLDRPRTDKRTYAAGAHSHTIPASLFSDIAALGKCMCTATPFVTVLTVFNILLHLHSPRWNREESPRSDIVVGIPTANRHYPGVESLIGFFANTLAIRTVVEDGDSFRKTLEKVKSRVISAQGAQDIPFDWVVDAVGVERRLSVQTLVQVMFVMDDWNFADSKTFSMNGIREVTQILDTEPVISKFDLTLRAVPQRNGTLHLQFEFARDILDDSTVARIADDMEQIMRSIVSLPDKPIRELPCINAVDIKRLATWNETEKEYRGQSVELHKAVHYLFEEAVVEHACLPALKCGNVIMSYRQLNQKVNQFAHFLRSIPGVEPGNFVPVVAESSVELFVAIYGVLKAGAAYIPIDPEAPPERVASILEDVAAVPVILLSHRSLKSCLSLYLERSSSSPNAAVIPTVICLHEDSDTWKSFPKTNPPHNIRTGREEVYAICTSGSTGKPKAAINTHIGICNWALWAREGLKLTKNDRVLFKTPFFFDAANFESFAPHVLGACVVVAPPGAHKDPEEIVNLVDDERITFIFLVPTALREFTSAVVQKKKEQWQQHTGNETRGKVTNGSAVCNSLRMVMAGGESLDWSLVHQVFETLDSSQVALLNAWGPSETACSTTLLDCFQALNEHPEMELNHPVVPIGKPISNVRILILDRNMQQVPVGVVGEIYVCGIAVGKGYLNRPEVTADKFVRTTTLTSDGKEFEGLTFYRTGDLGRFLESGDIEFHGRIDFQVKLHGLRIELGEIEKAIRSHEVVDNCTVILREDSFPIRRKFLAAYIVPRDKSINTLKASSVPSAINTSQSQALVSEVSHILQSKLPPYMVPKSITVMSKLPCTPSGKVDRKALPVPCATAAPVQDDSSSSGISEEPTVVGCEEEKLLLKCWKEILPGGGSGLTLDTDFFSAGGDSIMALQVASRARACGLKVTLRDFFEHKTIRRISSCAASKLGAVSVSIADERHQISHLSPGIEHPIIPQELLELLKEKGITEDQVEELFPATPSQVDILESCFRNNNGDVGGMYNVQLRIDYAGDLDVASFKRSWEIIVQNHPALRTAIISPSQPLNGGDVSKPSNTLNKRTTTTSPLGGPFFQVVLKHVDLEWDQQDLPALEQSLTDEGDDNTSQGYQLRHQIDEIAAEMREAPFNFEQPGLLRFHILRHTPPPPQARPLITSQTTFLCDLHHLIIDGWSMANIIHQLHETYASLTGVKEVVCHHHHPATSPPPSTAAATLPMINGDGGKGCSITRDFVKWLSGRDHAQAMEFWNRYFDATATTTQPVPKPKIPAPPATATSLCSTSKLGLSSQEKCRISPSHTAQP